LITDEACPNAQRLFSDKKPLVGGKAVRVVWFFNIPPLIPVVVYQSEINIRNSGGGRIQQEWCSLYLGIVNILGPDYPGQKKT
jgi:hypothetical protein